MLRTMVSRKFVPRMPGTTNFSTTTTVAIFRPSPSCIGLAAPRNFRHEVALSHTCLEITETTAPLSTNNEICKFSILPGTASTLPVCGLIVAIVLSAGRLEVVAGITLAATRRCGQSRRKWPCSPHRKHSVALRAGRLLFDLSSVICSWSNRRFRASTAWAMLSFPASAFSVVRCRLPPTSVSSSAAFSASWRAFTSVVGSRRRSSLWTSFDATPQMKRATNSLSDFPARRPNSATSWANSRIDWFFRCFRPLNRTASCIRDSPWP
ncbi:hypothetical protein T07_2610 [Trichinella nelsoni]|nr:hypothetical protein T07_2610 [Trichinella nelsoni]